MGVNKDLKVIVCRTSLCPIGEYNKVNTKHLDKILSTHYTYKDSIRVMGCR